MTKFNITQNEREVNKNISKILNPIDKEKRKHIKIKEEISTYINEVVK